MCWYHMRTKAQQRLSTIGERETREKIIQDIDALQLAPTVDIFDSAAKLPCKAFD